MQSYRHNDSIQCIAYNPVSPILASCSSTDFGLWSPEQKNVQKYRVPARICSCAWNDDGTFLALGLANGSVSIRNRVSLLLNHASNIRILMQAVVRNRQEKKEAELKSLPVIRPPSGLFVGTIQGLLSFSQSHNLKKIKIFL